MRDPKTDLSKGQIPSIIVGGRRMYVDNTGGLHPLPSAVINENMRTEGDFSRGVSGGCSQDPLAVPGGKRDK